MDPTLAAFETAILVDRVVNRHLARVAMEFSTPEARKKYLEEHPGADASKHTVKKEEKGGGKGKGRNVAPAAQAATKAKARSEGVNKAHEDMKSLLGKVENADSGARKKFDKAYDKIAEGGEAAAKDAKKLIEQYHSDEDDSHVGAAAKLLQHAVQDWETNTMAHAKHRDAMTGKKKLQQAEQSWAYARKIDEYIGMLDKALKGGSE